MKISRRDLIVSTGVVSASGFAPGLALGASGLGAPQAVTSPTAPRKLKYVVCGGHPGDPEYGFGGTIARLTRLGHEVVLLYLNDGAWPPASSATRMAEAKKACGLLKARPDYAGQANGHAIVDNAHYDRFQQGIDAEKPDAVITQWPI